jgi:hypothetical protein
VHVHHQQRLMQAAVERQVVMRCLVAFSGSLQVISVLSSAIMQGYSITQPRLI